MAGLVARIIVSPFRRFLDHDRHRRRHVRIEHQVPVAVQVADDQAADPLFLVGKPGIPELRHEMLRQVFGAGERVLVGGQVLGREISRRRRGVLRLVVVEILLPVDVVALDVAFVGLLEVRLGHFLRRCGQLARFDALVERRDHLRRRLVQLGLRAFGRLFEERVLLHLRADQIDQLEPRKLQKLDRLLQLGGHHQLLRHPQALLQFQRHPALSFTLA